jgi:hypothetical protein
MFCVIPEEAGIQLSQGVLDPGFRRGDNPIDFLRDNKNASLQKIRVSGLIPFDLRIFP